MSELTIYVALQNDQRYIIIAVWRLNQKSRNGVSQLHYQVEIEPLCRKPTGDAKNSISISQQLTIANPGSSVIIYQKYCGVNV